MKGLSPRVSNVCYFAPFLILQILQNSWYSAGFLRPHKEFACAFAHRVRHGNGRASVHANRECEYRSQKRENNLVSLFHGAHYNITRQRKQENNRYLMATLLVLFRQSSFAVPRSKSHHAIAISHNLFVMRQQFNPFRHGLRNKHPVERITMQPWQFTGLLRMIRNKRQFTYPRRHSIRFYLFWRTRHQNRFQGMFGGNLQYGHWTEEQLRTGIQQNRAHSLRQLRAVRDEPYQGVRVKQYPHRSYPLSACQAPCPALPSFAGNATSLWTIPCALLDDHLPT